MDFITFASQNSQVMSKQVENNIGAVNLVASSTKIVGDIQTESDIRIDGSHKGNLTTSGRLIIGPNGNLNGEIICKTAEIEGVLEGKIQVKELLSLKSTSNLKGEVITGQLMIEPGAIFSGNCKMSKPAEGKSK